MYKTNSEYMTLYESANILYYLAMHSLLVILFSGPYLFFPALFSSNSLVPEHNLEQQYNLPTSEYSLL